MENPLVTGFSRLQPTEIKLAMDQMLEVSLYRPTPSDLIAFLPFACRQLEAPFHLRILVETVEEYANKSTADDKGKKSKRDKTLHAPNSAGYSAEKEPSAGVAEPEYCDENELVLRTRYDSSGRPVELLFYRCVQVPRLLIKIIGLCIPYHEQLTRFAVRWGPLDGGAIYELAKFLPLSQLTEILLDDSPAAHRNYHLLLERPSRLRSLSLARCGLTDEDCAELAARLAHPLPASRTLVCISLESNCIGDAGACALGDALRTNRTLRHLDLAGNAITSFGAAHIFRSLMKFPVSRDEITAKRRRKFEHLRLRKDAYARYYGKLTQSSEQAAEEGRRRSHRPRKVSAFPEVAKSNGADALANRATALAAALVGAWADPFDPAALTVCGGTTCCAGNFSLSYLNLAYNDLDYSSARRLAEVLAYQTEAERRPGPGLLRAVLEGNALPAACDAVRVVEVLLERTLNRAGSMGGALLQLKSGRKSERPKFK